MRFDLNELTTDIKDWAIDRQLHKQDPVPQMLKVNEEVGELNSAMARDNKSGIVDAIGDTYVTLVVLCSQLDIDIGFCVDTAYRVIADRTGEIVNGVFVKDEDLKK